MDGLSTNIPFFQTPIPVKPDTETSPDNTSANFNFSIDEEFPEFQDLTQKATQFIKKMDSSSWSLPSESLPSEPEDIFSERNSLIERIKTVTSKIEKKDGSSSVVMFFATRLGFGPISYLYSDLQRVKDSLDSSWGNYLSRCRFTIERQVAEGSKSSAFQMYRKIMKIAPDHKELLESFGDFHKHIGQDEEAVSIYDLIKSSDNERILIKKARCLLNLHRPKDAIQIIGSINSFQEKELDVEAKLQMIEIKLKNRQYINAIDDLLRQIEKCPHVDNFKTMLIDAYLLYSQDDGGILFRENVHLLCLYYSMMSIYPTMKSFEDTVQIALDFFDYCSKKYVFVPNLFKSSLISHEKRHAEIIISHIDLIQKRIEKNISEKEVKLKELFNQLKSSDFSNKDEVYVIGRGVRLFSQELIGGIDSEIRVGLCKYNSFYCALAKQLKENVQDEPSCIDEMVEKGATLQKRIMDIIKALTRESESEVGLNELYQQRLNKSNIHGEDPDEVSAPDWIRRGNLMNFIQHCLVLPKDGYVDYLEKEGIQLDLLFESILMDMVSSIKTEQPKNRDKFLNDHGIDSISSLKSFIENPKNRRSVSKPTT